MREDEGTARRGKDSACHHWIEKIEMRIFVLLQYRLPCHDSSWALRPAERSLESQEMSSKNDEPLLYAAATGILGASANSLSLLIPVVKSKSAAGSRLWSQYWPVRGAGGLRHHR